MKQAVAYLRDNMADRITLSQLTSACGASERTLLRQFQTFLGIAPLAYLRRLRLNAAKSKLTNPGNDDVIADIAIRCGFAHLGRFAADYRRLFNETPSATRHRARLMAAGVISRPGAGVAPLPIRSDRPSLVILPLRTETLQESLLARDLGERLAATLSRLRIASVSLAHPSRSFSLTAPQPRNAGTHYYLLGRLAQQGERVRVIVRLVDVAAHRHVWGDCFDGLASDLFELQDRVVDGVLCGAVSHITDSEVARSSDKDPKDLSAGDVALQALPLILNANVVSAQKAAVILDRALELDPANAVAAALLAFSQLQLVLIYGTLSPATAIDAADRLSQRAIALDNKDPLVLVACGGVAHWLRRFDPGGMTRSVEYMRREHPHLTVGYHAENFAASDPLWLEALESAGMPLT